MTEATFWSTTVRPRLGMFGILKRMENRIGEGTPDVCFCLRRYKTGEFPAVSGWLELKHSYTWPTQDTTPLTFNHFTIEQVQWMEEWHQHGGRVCVLAQVANDYMLVPPWNARRIQAGVSRPEFFALSDVHGRRSFPTAEIVRWLTR